MQLFIESMDKEKASAILNWRYEAPYDFYNNELTDEALQELLDGSYNAIVDDKQQLIGFFCVGKGAQVPAGNRFDAYTASCVDMGFGMNPHLTGQGNGFDFCSLIMQFIEQNYAGTPIRLTVAKFNQRAIHLYEKLGFVAQAEFSSELAEFIVMTRKSLHTA
ncbi:GNAT family protein [Lysinibacillus louembei]|uniref:GNAT family protein n=1 Tax=Lysinibacillus louembei TaxID=1470088 RepID=A0ABZ0RRV6_9BACI|nr:GNAT family protein [Lysinibacillus louembei]WPK10962.1 GNAT family protein [Lysinibacillus louembei]